MLPCRFGLRCIDCRCEVVCVCVVCVLGLYVQALHSRKGRTVRLPYVAISAAVFVGWVLAATMLLYKRTSFTCDIPAHPAGLGTRSG